MLHESLRVLRPKGAAIICDFMGKIDVMIGLNPLCLESLSKNAVADLSTLFDSFSSSEKFFKLYCMNQFEVIDCDLTKAKI
jgi:hypothetical protein